MGPTWDQIREQIRGQVPKNSFELWINPITLLASQNGTWVLGCPNKFARNWITENYLELIRTTLQQAGAAGLEITLKVEPPEAAKAPPRPAAPCPEIPSGRASWGFPLSRTTAARGG